MMRMNERYQQVDNDENLFSDKPIDSLRQSLSLLMFDCGAKVFENLFENVEENSIWKDMSSFQRTAMLLQEMSKRTLPAEKKVYQMVDRYWRRQIRSYRKEEDAEWEKTIHQRLLNALEAVKTTLMDILPQRKDFLSYTTWWLAVRGIIIEESITLSEIKEIFTENRSEFPPAFVSDWEAAENLEIVMDQTFFLCQKLDARSSEQLAANDEQRSQKATSHPKRQDKQTVCCQLCEKPGHTAKGCFVWKKASKS